MGEPPFLTIIILSKSTRRNPGLAWPGAGAGPVCVQEQRGEQEEEEEEEQEEEEESQVNAWQPQLRLDVSVVHVKSQRSTAHRW